MGKKKPQKSDQQEQQNMQKLDSIQSEDESEDNQQMFTIGKLKQKHKKETLALKKQIQQLGKGKKEEAKQLEQEMNQRQAKEVQEFEIQQDEGELEKNLIQQSNKEEDTHIAQKAQALNESLYGMKIDGMEQRQTKDSKALRRKNKKEIKEQELQALKEYEKSQIGPSKRDLELNKIQSQLSQKGLNIKQIQADGNCLYRAIEDQLKQRQKQKLTFKQSNAEHILNIQQDQKNVINASATHNGYNDQVLQSDTNITAHNQAEIDPQTIQNLDYSKLRQIAAHYLREHRNEYQAFVELDVYKSSDPYEEYCSRIQNSCDWGGHVELLSLAKSLKKNIMIYQAQGNCELISYHEGGIQNDEDQVEEPLQLTFHKHYYALGDHYNSVEPYQIKQ